MNKIIAITSCLVSLVTLNLPMQAMTTSVPSRELTTIQKIVPSLATSSPNPKDTQQASDAKIQKSQKVAGYYVATCGYVTYDGGFSYVYRCW
jgi:hypothetical protein